MRTNQRVDSTKGLTVADAPSGVLLGYGANLLCTNPGVCILELIYDGSWSVLLIRLGDRGGDYRMGYGFASDILHTYILFFNFV